MMKLLSNLIVTIFHGPGEMCRVRELDDDSDESMVVKWCGDYDDAVEFVRENYSEEQAVCPDEFRAEAKKRNG